MTTPSRPSVIPGAGRAACMRDDPSQKVGAGAGAPPEMPPVAGHDARFRHRLPTPLTSFVGRDQELAQLEQLVETCRLLTLTGPGGCGKTRLALELIARVGRTRAHPIHVVSLAPIANPSLVTATIAQAVGVREATGQTLADAIVRHIGERRTLMVLDNFEHLVSAASVVAGLLADCPNLTVVVTSRELLRLRVEHVFPIQPLTVPDPALASSLDEGAVSRVAESEAGQLFVERARSVQPTFCLNASNASAVAEICVRLDGLPLAIELAAARVRLLSARAIAARLERRLSLLTDGPRDLPSRQQTLRTAIAWSYDLLESVEQVVFRRLAVFVGGLDLDAVAWMQGAVEIGGVSSSANVQQQDRDPLALVASLVDKSLLRSTESPDGEPRFRMLETIREYALEELDVREETEAARLRHAAFCLHLAKLAEPNLELVEAGVWLDRLEVEHDNLRAALAWGVAAEDGRLLFARLAAALWKFWWIRGYTTEGRRWLDRALLESAPSDLRVELLNGAGQFALSYHDSYHDSGRAGEV